MDSNVQKISIENGKRLKNRPFIHFFICHIYYFAITKLGEEDYCESPLKDILLWEYLLFYKFRKFSIA